MNILLCGDVRHSNGILLTMLSLLQKASEPLNIHILTAENKSHEAEALSTRFMQSAERVTSCYGSENSVTLHDISEIFNEETKKKEPRNSELILPFFSDMIDSLRGRVLFVAAGVICRRDPGDLYRADMEGCAIGGVARLVPPWFVRSRDEERCALDASVLLMDLDKIREIGLFSRVRSLVKIGAFRRISRIAARKKIFPSIYNEHKKTSWGTVFRNYNKSGDIRSTDKEFLHSRLGVYEHDALIDELDIIRSGASI